jgi:hypothetical protein
LSHLRSTCFIILHIIVLFDRQQPWRQTTTRRQHWTAIAVRTSQKKSLLPSLYFRIKGDSWKILSRVSSKLHWLGLEARSLDLRNNGNNGNSLGRLLRQRLLLLPLMPVTIIADGRGLQWQLRESTSKTSLATNREHGRYPV